MAAQLKSPNFFRPLTEFLVSRVSRFMPSIPKIGYYVMMRHLKNQGSLQNKFLFYFDSQVYPTILPGYAQFVPDYDLYLNTELDFKILTEDDLILTQDVFLKYN